MLRLVGLQHIKCCICILLFVLVIAKSSYRMCLRLCKGNQQLCWAPLRPPCIGAWCCWLAQGLSFSYCWHVQDKGAHAFNCTCHFLWFTRPGSPSIGRSSWLCTTSIDSTLPSLGYSMWNPWNGGWTAEIPGGFHGMVDGFHTISIWNPGGISGWTHNFTLIPPSSNLARGCLKYW